jgi:hypothetical protein
MMQRAAKACGIASYQYQPFLIEYILKYPFARIILLAWNMAISPKYSHFEPWVRQPVLGTNRLLVEEESQTAEEPLIVRHTTATDPLIAGISVGVVLDASELRMDKEGNCQPSGQGSFSGVHERAYSAGGSGQVQVPEVG